MGKNDNVKHPKHYTQGIEMWEYAYSQGLDFFEGNIIKYVTRWKHKGGIEDLLKAKQYLDKLIEMKKIQNNPLKIFLYRKFCVY
jgi:hypothetical protein